ncbi:MAG: phosphoglycerate kinase [Nitrososphaeria archaeon]|nr:phosphoglycerate kinase [Conexivisphaerales archaeon]
MIKVADLELPTFDDVDLSNKKVLLRVDFNSPVERESKKLMDTSRIKAHAPTIKELIEKGNSVVIITHQGRPGDDDFSTLELHRDALSDELGIDVKFVNDIFGPCALDEIKNLRNGEVLMLDNIRLAAEELIEASPDVQSRTYLVRRLAPLFDIYINDAFATAHRSQPSLVGFPLVLPSAAGRLMEKELVALSKIFNIEESPKVFVLGGGKVLDSIRIIENLSKKRIADRILLGGLVAEVFALAKGVNIGDQNKKILDSQGFLPLIPRARKVLLSGAPVEIPVDFIVEGRDGMKENYATNVNGVIKDIGPETINVYSTLLNEAKVVVLRGPMGVIEDERFRIGTLKLMNSALSSDSYTIVGGGHLLSLLQFLNVNKDKLHISTGGGALLLFLAGERLPALDALAQSVKVIRR